MDPHPRTVTETHFYISFLQFSTDVVACNRNPKTDVVQGLDTYNEPDERANDVDPHQNVVLFSSNYTDGRIICRCVPTHRRLKQLEGEGARVK